MSKNKKAKRLCGATIGDKVRVEWTEVGKRYFDKDKGAWVQRDTSWTVGYLRHGDHGRLYLESESGNYEPVFMFISASSQTINFRVIEVLEREAMYVEMGQFPNFVDFMLLKDHNGEQRNEAYTGEQWIQLHRQCKDQWLRYRNTPKEGEILKCIRTGELLNYVGVDQSNPRILLGKTKQETIVQIPRAQWWRDYLCQTPLTFGIVKDQIG
jgi:hypothetical protein